MAETERYDEDRPEMVNLVPPMAHRVLDAGCSTGRFGAALREHMPDAEIIGIDTRPQSAATMSSYDRFITGMFPGDMPSALPFDCVVFNDVLEHMVDPWDVLRHTHSMLTPTASVIASIPNIRHVSVLAPLAIKGRWDYRDTGILDRTHLRFFTRASVHYLFTSTGYCVDDVQGIRMRPSRGRLVVFNRVVRGRLDDFLAERFAVTAHSSTLKPSSKTEDS